MSHKLTHVLKLEFPHHKGLGRNLRLHALGIEEKRTVSFNPQLPHPQKKDTTQLISYRSRCLGDTQNVCLHRESNLCSLIVQLVV